MPRSPATCLFIRAGDNQRHDFALEAAERRIALANSAQLGLLPEDLFAAMERFLNSVKQQRNIDWLG